MKLEFDGQGGAVASYFLEKSGDGTKVTWAFSTDHGNNLISRYFGLMFESMIGPMYEKGLKQIKTQVEKIKIEKKVEVAVPNSE